jgi:hypothetical protein
VRPAIPLKSEQKIVVPRLVRHSAHFAADRPANLDDRSLIPDNGPRILMGDFADRR